jgi:hypothetical protein
VSVTVSEGGVLTASFSSGIELCAYPADDIEAWELVGPDGAITIALPGGGHDGWG